jgi:uncharacterized protein (TIGR03905 family)
MGKETRLKANSQPSRYIYRTTGVCASEIHFQIRDGVLSEIRFVGGGCPGNAQLVARLLEGRAATKVAEELKGLVCRDGTSCPDQLSRAIREVQAGRLTTAESFRVHADPVPHSRIAVVGDLSGPAEVFAKVIAHARGRAVEAIYCLGNLVGSVSGIKSLRNALRRGELIGILGEDDWRLTQAPEEADRPYLTLKEKDLLARLPQVVRFDLRNFRAVAFHGDYLQRLPGYSDYDPFALEINMVCGLTRFMQDEAVFPALEAMIPQFQADIVLFSKPRSWGHWQVGGKDFIGVGPAWDGGTMAWGLLEAGTDGAIFNTILEPFNL